MPSIETSSISSSSARGSASGAAPDSGSRAASGASAIVVGSAIPAPSCEDGAVRISTPRDEYVEDFTSRSDGIKDRGYHLRELRDNPQPSPDSAARRGRPPGTSRRTLELIALRLFAEQGFDETPIEQIAAEAGVSRRTFFRYFESKASGLWGEFDSEVTVIREALAKVPDSVPMMDAIQQAVVAANHYRAGDVPELRARMNLIGSVPALQSSAAVHYDDWERAVSEFVGTRIGQPPWSLYPLVVGRSTLAACRAAYDRWSARAGGDLTVYLDAALSVLATGFAAGTLDFPEPEPEPDGRPVG